MPPLLSFSTDEIPPEKLEALEPHEIIEDTLPMHESTDPYETRVFLANLHDFREWLRRETVKEHPGKIVGNHIKMLVTVLDQLMKVIKRVGIKR